MKSIAELEAIKKKVLDNVNLRQEREEGVRVVVDARNEKIGYKIREAQLQKFPYMLVIGDKEVENEQVAVRSRKEGDCGVMGVEDFVARITKEIENKER